MAKSGMYKPSGELQGDTKPMPDRGTTTGLQGDTYGADLSLTATNSMGGISGATRSAAPGEENINDKDVGDMTDDNQGYA